MKTFTATQDDLAHEWHVVDATDVPLGRLASEVAQIIRGKHKPTFTPHMDTGDFVIVINASKVALTGTKIDSKQYFRHTGYMGHERYTSARNMLAKHPELTALHSVASELAEKEGWTRVPEGAWLPGAGTDRQPPRH